LISGKLTKKSRQWGERDVESFSGARDTFGRRAKSRTVGYPSEGRESVAVGGGGTLMGGGENKKVTNINVTYCILENHERSRRGTGGKEEIYISCCVKNYRESFYDKRGRQTRKVRREGVAPGVLSRPLCNNRKRIPLRMNSGSAYSTQPKEEANESFSGICRKRKSLPRRWKAMF